VIKLIQNGSFSGEIAIPSSKSDGQRALLAAAISTGISTISGLGASADELAMLAAIEEMGAKISKKMDGSFEIEGVRELPHRISVSSNESGLGFRLLTGTLASFLGEKTIKASGSLKTRTMTVFEGYLPKMGVEVHSENGFPPLKITGKLKAGRHEIDGSLSSQFISGLLFGFSRLNEESTIQVNNLVSRPYVDMTLTTLRAFGAEITETDPDTFTIHAREMKSTSYNVESDWSSAGYWLVASALGQNLTIHNLNLESKQADRNLLKVFDLANCAIDYSNGVQIDGKNRTTFEFDATDCPDLFPALVVFAAGINGKSIISGTNRLVHKESNRALTLQSEFGKLGLKIELIENEMHVFGTGKLTGGKVHSHNDHRIAMSLGIASCLSNSGIEIEGAEAVSKSYPTFWDDFEQIKNFNMKT
jgi:3-phosphoshikimate 1-carboxyvinyltransferase